MTTEDEDTISILADLEKCPECGANLVGDPIPENRRDLFTGHTHWTRLWACEEPHTGRVTSYMCPDCKTTIAREDGPEVGFRTCNVKVE